MRALGVLATLAWLTGAPVRAQQQAGAEGPKLSPPVEKALREGALPGVAVAGESVRFVAGEGGQRAAGQDVLSAFACYGEALRKSPLQCADADGSAEELRAVVGTSAESVQGAAVIGLSLPPPDKASPLERLETRLPRFLIVASAKPCPETQRLWLRHRRKAPAQPATEERGADAAEKLADRALCLGAAKALSQRARGH